VTNLFHIYKLILYFTTLIKIINNLFSYIFKTVIYSFQKYELRIIWNNKRAIISLKRGKVMGKKTKYEKYAEDRAKKSNIVSDCIKAFITGGIICTLAECLFKLFIFIGISEYTVKILVPSTLVFLTAILTGLDIFDNIAKFGGAGTLVPITGFANAVVSPAIDNKSEGYVLGVGAKIFTIAGPVILYGTVASVIYGIIYWITTII